MHDAVTEFAFKYLTTETVSGKHILELGSAGNSRIREKCVMLHAASYIGMDMMPDRNVDIVGDIEQGNDMLGQYAGIICTEVFEHVRHWWKVVENISAMLADGAWALITTRSPGYPVHYHPEDHWRYTVEDMQAIFGTWIEDIWTQLIIDRDSHRPGVFVFVSNFSKKTLEYRRPIFESILRHRAVYSIVHGREVSQHELLRT